MGHFPACTRRHRRRETGRSPEVRQSAVLLPESLLGASYPFGAERPTTGVADKSVSPADVDRTPKVLRQGAGMSKGDGEVGTMNDRTCRNPKAQLFVEMLTGLQP